MGEEVDKLARMRGFLIVVFCSLMLDSDVGTASWNAGVIKVQCSSIYCLQEHVFATMCTGEGEEDSF